MPNEIIQVAERRADVSLLTDQDIYLFNEGKHYRIYDKLGSHLTSVSGQAGTSFSVWAPNARQVSVMGSFNGWNPDSHPLRARASSGIWEGFLPGVNQGTLYKFHIVSHNQGYVGDKADPFGVFHENPPRTASVVWDLTYEWNDREWMVQRPARSSLQAPISIYEVHLGSWMRVPEEHNRSLNYRELAPRLAEYVQRMQFTHVELLPVMEHPFSGSWGYQTTGYFAPTSRYGTPQELMALIDALHAAGIGGILDWVPSHFPSDAHGLAYFDGTHLFEHADWRSGFHPDWNTYIYNYGRNEVRSFLMSSAMFWLDEFHADGLRVDAVASMLYLDYSRREGQWAPNQFGGRENLDAISFLQEMNATVYKHHPGVMTVAEESTAWPGVTRPTYLHGLGFGFKWNMGWMNDTLAYVGKEPIHRQWHHHQMTFSLVYAWSENYILPISHDEVVHGKGSLVGKMPGDMWQKLANARALLAFMWAHPGKQLIFMGSELADDQEWSESRGLNWDLLGLPDRAGMQRLVRDLNVAYRDNPPLWTRDTTPDGFRWISAEDSAHNTFSFVRYGDDGSPLVCIVNFAAVPQENYRIGLPSAGTWAV